MLDMYYLAISLLFYGFYSEEMMGSCIMDWKGSWKGGLFYSSQGFRGYSIQNFKLFSGKGGSKEERKKGY